MPWLHQLDKSDLLALSRCHWSNINLVLSFWQKAGWLIAHTASLLSDLVRVMDMSNTGLSRVYTTSWACFWLLPFIICGPFPAFLYDSAFPVAGIPFAACKEKVCCFWLPTKYFPDVFIKWLQNLLNVFIYHLQPVFSACKEGACCSHFQNNWAFLILLIFHLTAVFS